MKNPIRTWSLRSRLVLGIVILSAFGFVLSSIVAQQALRGYLTSRVDADLTSIASNTLPRILQGGIASDDDETETSANDREHDHRAAPIARGPLQRIPTSTTITLLDPEGIVIGGLGGEFNSAEIATYLRGLTPTKASLYRGEAFTVDTSSEDFRAIAFVLPNNSGTVVAAQSLGALDKTINQLRFFFLLIGLLLISLIAIASRIVIKVSMRPLEAVEVTAEQIAAGDFSARMPDAEPSTEVGRLVNSLNSMLARIESSFAARAESENRLRRFVADASHELRTPITAIRGFAELHRQGAIKDGEPTKELIGRIEGESKRMGSLVEDLLLLARLDQAREMDSKPVDLIKVVDEAVASARVAGPRHLITFNAPDDELFALGDEARIHQVVANLLANARAHTPAGTSITVNVLRVENGVEISVSDTGPGISIEDQERIFERFYRADPSRVRIDGEGSGLGLSIVDAVMRAHGGSVRVASELGKGTTFTLFFPLSN